MRVHRRLGTAAVALGVVVSGVPLGAAAPARAVPVPVGTSSTSTYNSGSPKFDTAGCPAGQIVLSGGGTITDGAGHVVLSDVILGRTTVTVMAYEVTAYSGNWSVTATAVCGPEEEDVVITWATGSGTTAAKSATVYCPAGTKLYGTGYELPGADGQVFPSAVRPDDALSRVTVKADAHGGYTGDWNLVAYAACAKPAAHMRLLTARSATGPAAAKAVTTEACPGLAHVHGVGAEISGGHGDVILAAMTPSSLALTRSQAGAHAHGRVAEDWSVTSYAICST
ncbi:hypothetical protein [Phytohabitans aurantiacus]|jgi:hypothetical protein|uniref:Uncharacterized protein n=1 Tax=Phytohabitans aurantiacus TaxID=3016789 RepID=A0ABQ5R1B3_9ACTN|nr:hypothetical protein [Phytohabitans aurantiacus]GLI00594.1 hypothetical protein Pa4123_58700 [Phytohabitans aurantiacus]